MEKKINIAELLKDCPSGMELDCTTWENVTFNQVVGNEIYIKRNDKIPVFGSIVILNKYGRATDHKDEKCRIFPKGKTTWEGFIPPYKFKDGDVITCTNAVCTFTAIFKDKPTEKSFIHYCSIINNNTFTVGLKYADYINPRFATEAEKQKLFEAIKANNYHWNPEKKTLEKLIKPIFKKGDRVKVKNGVSESRIIDGVYNTFYTLVPIGKIDFTDQNNWELVPDKFDISTLIPFESKVLVRSSKGECWTPAFFGRKCKDNGYITTFGWCQYCIPFEPNIYLMGTTQDCSNFYKTWE